MKVKTYIIVHNKKRFVLRYGRMCQMGGWDCKLHTWQLEHDGDLVGHFHSKAAAEERIKEYAK